MIELEIQTLSLSREGLLIDVGRTVVASGFTLQRQRLVQDPHGVLLTLVVRGPARKQRALEAALGANERIISFNASPFEEGPPKPHFAASRTFARERVAPAPAPVPEVNAEPVAEPAVAPVAVAENPVDTPAPETMAPLATVPQPRQDVQPEPEPEFFFIPTRPPAPAPAPVASEPYVEVVQLGPDVDAVDKVMSTLTNSYPQIFALLQGLERSVADASRESTLQLAGQRMGTWVFERDYAHESKLDLEDAMNRIGVPALSAFAHVEYRGGQLHIRDSPLCAEGGHSGCRFFDGYIEGLIGHVTSSNNLSIFAVCCRSYGADACVLAISH
jgi:hypothetical protein